MGKRRNCSLLAIPLFPTVFSKDLYCRCLKTRACLGKSYSTIIYSYFNGHSAKPHNSVGSPQYLRTGGRWFDPRVGQYSFLEFMIVIATGLIPLSLLSIVSTMLMWESSQLLGRNIVWRTDKKNSNMDRCIGSRDITEILLKTALNTMQSISQSKTIHKSHVPTKLGTKQDITYLHVCTISVIYGTKQGITHLCIISVTYGTVQDITYLCVIAVIQGTEQDITYLCIISVIHGTEQDITYLYIISVIQGTEQSIAYLYIISVIQGTEQDITYLCIIAVIQGTEQDITYLCIISVIHGTELDITYLYIISVIQGTEQDITYLCIICYPWYRARHHISMYYLCDPWHMYKARHHISVYSYNTLLIPDLIIR